MRLFQQCLTTLRAPERVGAIDVFRGVAVLAVVLYHPHRLMYGYLGVDLFFVVSGLLIGRILLRQVGNNQSSLRLLPFVLGRGLKIWPSYYAMLGLGSLFAYIAYADTHPTYLISLEHWPRYLFFFQNYRNAAHKAFDHVWSICVEEHFYVLLPIVLIGVVRLKLAHPKVLLGIIVSAIAAGTVGKFVGHRVGFETYSATHNRIDALAWGVLLAWILEQRPEWLNTKTRRPMFVSGLLLAALMLCWDMWWRTKWSHDVALQIVMPASFFLTLAGTLHLPARTRWLWPVRFIAYYSYNLYLWHPLILPAVQDKFGLGWLSELVYFVVSMAIAVVMTWPIEEPMLRIRNAALARLGPTKSSPRAASS